MRKVILTAGICIASLFGAQAQQVTGKNDPATSSVPGNKNEMVAKFITQITSACHLSTDQASEAKPMVEEFITSRMANKQKYGTDKASLKTANQASTETLNTKMKPILQADQMQLLVGFEKQQAAKREAAEQKASK
jgi:hypothetical protein